MRVGGGAMVVKVRCEVGGIGVDWLWSCGGERGS